ncbi:DUF1203 domain-containing protein [Pinirhizobacter soli]|uniref:DUF1203 domain-containing protein n=1 Tax=Pinirhizobacter soli TaxID=2786953 RepID=UPI002029DA3D|nr:DUF1203 domain-containing protein [Pinirhizobacter soli]
MSYRVSGLDPAPFLHLYHLSDEALREHRAVRYVAGTTGGFPDRVELRDARPGESLLLVNYEHQPADTPYRSRHAVFVLEGATTAATFYDEIPLLFRKRMMSLRAFTTQDMLHDAKVMLGDAMEPTVQEWLADDRVAYIHAHYAGPGCYAGRIDRA